MGTLISKIMWFMPPDPSTQPRPYKPTLSQEQIRFLKEEGDLANCLRDPRQMYDIFDSHRSLYKTQLDAEVYKMLVVGFVKYYHLGDEHVFPEDLAWFDAKLHRLLIVPIVQLKEIDMLWMAYYLSRDTQFLVRVKNIKGKFQPVAEWSYRSHQNRNLFP